MSSPTAAPSTPDLLSLTKARALLALDAEKREKKLEGMPEGVRDKVRNALDRLTSLPPEKQLRHCSRAPKQPAELAGVLYETYCAAVGGKALNGDPLPSWEEMSKDTSKVKQTEGWQAVARKVAALRQSSCSKC